MNAELDDEILYHYTSLDAFQKIVTSGEIWATDSRYLNDTTEFKYSLDLAKEVLEGRNLKNSDYAEGFIASANQTSIYVFSLSKRKDLLSQWRAYCPNGGVSIGFSKRVLEIFAKQQRFELVKCIYSREKQKERLIAAIEETERPDYRAILGVLAAFKHYGFEEEEEYRLISEAPTYESRMWGGGEHEPEWRTTTSMLIQYKKFLLSDLNLEDLKKLHPNLSEDKVKGLLFREQIPAHWHEERDRPEPYREVIVSPSAHQELVENAVSEFVKSKTFYGKSARAPSGRVNVSSSSVPYRSG